MKHFKVVAMVGLMTVFFIVGIAFEQSGGQGMGGQGAAPKMGCQERFDAMDANKDGQVSKEEFMAHAEKMFKSMDVSERGYLTKDEFCLGKEMAKGKGMGKDMVQGMGQVQGTGTKQ